MTHKEGNVRFLFRSGEMMRAQVYSVDVDQWSTSCCVYATTTDGEEMTLRGIPSTLLFETPELAARARSVGIDIEIEHLKGQLEALVQKKTRIERQKLFWQEKV